MGMGKKAVRRGIVAASMCAFRSVYFLLGGFCWI